MTDTAPSPAAADQPARARPARMADELAQPRRASSPRSTCSIAQAKTEAARHESRRAAAAEKLTRDAAATSAGTTLDPTVAAELNAQLVRSPSAPR